MSRRAWGGDQCPPRQAARYGTVELAFVHHTVGTNDYSPEESPSIVLALCQYHRNINGWDDIGYNFLVDKHGQIFEGRAGGIEQAVVGAQAQGYNSVSTGVANVGTFSTEEQEDAAVEAMARLLAWKLSLHGVPVEGTVTVVSGGGPSNRYPAGQKVTLQRVSGHRDGDATACPGDGLYGQLPELRRRAAGHAAALRPAGSLTLEVKQRRVAYRAPTVLTGTLVLPDGSRPLGAAIELQILGRAGYRTISTARTNANGDWSTTVRRSRNAVLRALHRRADGTSQVSSSLRIFVRTRLELGGLSPAMSAGSKRHVSGRVRPRKRRVVLVVERKGRDGRYGRAKKVTLRTRRARFSFPLHLDRPGSYRITALTNPDSRNVSGKSEPLYVRAR